MNLFVCFFLKITAPHLTGLKFKLFVKLLETPLVGPLIISHLKKENKIVEVCFLFFFKVLC
jgi:hypothetical protein